MHNRLAHNRLLRIAAAALIVLSLASVVGLQRPERAASAPVPDCAGTATPSPGCGFYVTLPDGTKVLGGTNTASPTTVSKGTSVTQTATVAMTPTQVTDGNVIYTAGMNSVSLSWGGSFSGPITSWSPQSSGRIVAGLNLGGGGVTWGTTDGKPLPAGFTASMTATASTLRISSNGPCPCALFDATWGTQNARFGYTGESASPTITVLSGGPTAAFSATQSAPATSPGAYQFVSSSTDSGGEALVEDWNWGDGTAHGSGASALHTYTKPGTYTAVLTVTDTDGHSSSVEHQVVVAAPSLQTDVSFVDAHGRALTTVTPKIGDTVYAKLTVSTTDGVGPISHITFGGGSPLVVSPTAAASLGTPSKTVPSPLTIAPDSEFTTTYPVTVLANGLARFTSSPKGKDASGATVTGTVGQRSYSVSGLTVALSVDPAKFVMQEDENGPTPVDVTVTETITNITDGPVTHVVLRSLEPTRAEAGELMNVTYLTGSNPSSVNGQVLDDIPAGGHLTLTAVYAVNDDGKIEFDSLVTAADSDGTTISGYGTTQVEADPKYYFEVRSHVVSPRAGLLPAGSPIVVTGTVTNLSDTATESVAPLFAQVAGNAGVQSFTWDASGADPKALASVGDAHLDPGDSKDFTLKILTAYSEPVVGASPLTEKPASGGTRATVTLTPWVTVTRDDGTTFETDKVDTTGHGDGDILTSDGDLAHQVSIDDSIAIPKQDSLAVADGFLRGTLEGLWNGASGMVTGLVGLPKVSASTLFAIVQYQGEVWKNLTPAQRADFDQSYLAFAVDVLQANYTMAKQGLPALRKKVDAATLNYFTTMENEYQTGDYAGIVEKYTALSTDAVAQTVIPIALGQLAKSTTAVEALEAAQEANDTKAAAVVGEVGDSATVEQAYTSVTNVPSGVSLAASKVASMFGVTESELGKLQALADKYNFLVVVRSRAASSIEWIEKFSAMLKPEIFKIKSVSALDVRLGYPASYEGALIFKEPTPLIEFNRSGGDLSSLTEAFVESKGFTPGTAEYDNAITRMNERMAEWNKWSKTYQKWAEQKWVNTSFNWKGNAMRDPNVAGSGRFPGFRMEPLPGQDNTFVMKMYNPKTGTYVPLTGDIDPIAFTHVDGTPLTREEHATLLNEMRLDPELQAQHGESATYVDGGVDFIAKQFKPGEAALMIGPGQSLPRTVRFNKALSIWKSPTNYHLAWEGGFVSTGANPASTGTLSVSLNADAVAATGALAEKVQAVPGNGTADQPNVGRCAVTYDASATPTFMNSDGDLGSIVGTSVQESALESECFTDGPVEPVNVAPTTVTPTAILSGQTEIPIDPNAAYGQRGDGDLGFQVGQQVEVDPGSPDAETGTIAGFGSIILAHPLKHDHPAGTVIVMIKAAPRSAHSSSGAGTLAATGSGDLEWQLGTGLLGLLAGGAATVVGRRRRRYASAA